MRDMRSAIARKIVLVLVFILACAAFSFVIDILRRSGWDVGKLFDFEYWRNGGTLDRSELVRNLGLLAIAALGLVFAIWRTTIAQTTALTGQKQAYLMEQGQITDRYAKAIEMLGAPEALTRIGAIFSLSRIAIDSPDRDVLPVMETLAEFVRNPPYEEEQAEFKKEQERCDNENNEALSGRKPHPLDLLEVPKNIPCPDVKAALRIIQTHKPDLSEANLMGFDLDLCSFEQANLIGANFTGASLNGANFHSASLNGAKLIRVFATAVIFDNAAMQIANLSGANLRGSSFQDSDLTNASIGRANLETTLQLTQSQIDTTVDAMGPASLPAGLKWKGIDFSD